MEKKYAMRVISNSCGVLPHTLRVWEKRYKVFNPERSEGGQRLYSEKDLEKARCLAGLVERGHSISKIANFSLEELKELLSSHKSKEPLINYSIDIEKLLGHLSNYEIEKVREELQYLRMKNGLKDFLFQIVLPLMREAGKLVEKRDYSITQEHIISTIVREQLGHVNTSSSNYSLQSFTFATPEGNIHELSILIAKLIAQANRLPTHYLGAAHPADCLSEAMNALKSKCLVLGVVSSDQWNYENKISSYLKKIDENLNGEIEVFLGGGFKIELPKFKKISKVHFLNSFEEFDKYLSGLM